MEASTKFTKINVWATIVLTIATVFLAYYAYRAHQDTLSILRQNEASDLIKDRAYLSINNISTKSLGDGQYLVVFGLHNFGATPAYDIRTTFQETINGNASGTTQLGAGPDIINPGEDKNLPEIYSANYLETFNESTSSFWTIRIDYQDYASSSHQRTEVFLPNLEIGAGLNILINSENDNY